MEGGSGTPEDILYPLGDRLVKRLITTFGREKFMDLLADQIYDHAKKIYGEGLDTLLIPFRATRSSR
jgi:hypothetical protein